MNEKSDKWRNWNQKHMEENHKISEMRTKFQKFPWRLDLYGNLIKNTENRKKCNQKKEYNIKKEKG